MEIQAYKHGVKEIDRLVAEVGGCSIMGLTYRNEHGEKSRYRVNLGVDHDKTLAKDLGKLDHVKALIFGELTEEFGEAVAKKAFEEKEKSMRASLDGTNARANAQHEAYVYIRKGMKYGTATRRLYVYGYVMSKVVLERGVYPVVKSRPLTLAKKKIDKYMKAAKYRQFIIELDKLERFTTGGNTVNFDLV